MARTSPSRLLPYAFAFAAACTPLCPAAHAAVTVLVGEPYGSFGTMMPVGHTTIYLDRVCADGPLKLRMCTPGEPQGVAIARYHQLGQIDWIATPILQFLYASDRPQDVPTFVTHQLSVSLREQYRQHYLRSVIPDGTEHDKQTDEWDETAGAAFDRRLWAYQLASTPAQDQALVARMNADPNHHLYHLKATNCADFAASILNLYYPGAVTPNHLADFGIMSPKQVARRVSAYGHQHPSSDLRVFEIPQIPGDLRRSRPLRGGAEGLLKTKRYLATLLVIQPELPLVLSVLYLDRGRWTIGRNAEVLTPASFEPAPITANSAGLATCAITPDCPAMQ